MMNATACARHDAGQSPWTRNSCRRSLARGDIPPPASVEALVVPGEMWLTVGNDIRHLKPGDTFALEREIPHSERYGPEGATYWAARRNR